MRGKIPTLSSTNYYESVICFHHCVHLMDFDEGDVLWLDKSAILKIFRWAAEEELKRISARKTIKFKKTFHSELSIK